MSWKDENYEWNAGRRGQSMVHVFQWMKLNHETAHYSNYNHTSEHLYINGMILLFVLLMSGIPDYFTSSYTILIIKRSGTECY